MGWGWGSHGCLPGRPDLLCVLALLAGCLLPVCRTRVYTNHWAVKIAGGFAEADRIASKYGFINVGQVTSPRWLRLSTQQLAVGGFLSPPLRPLPLFQMCFCSCGPNSRAMFSLAHWLHSHTHAPKFPGSLFNLFLQAVRDR